MKKKIVAPEAVHLENKEIEVFEQTENHKLINEKISANKRALQKYESKREYLYPLERIVQDRLVIRNVKYPGADEDFPHSHQALCRFVTMFYPNAKGGGLYVDEPLHEQQRLRAYDRQKKMKARKLRHLVLERNSTYEELLEQLGEF